MSSLRPSLDVVASIPLIEAPVWAVLQRKLFALLDDAWREFEATYCAPDGSLVYAGPMHDRDGVDDFYEPFFNWPVLYRLGGSSDLLAAAKHHWEGVTGQMTDFGFVKDEYELGYDWFHQGESMIFFYALCAADPDDAAFRERAERFARLYLPGSANYDEASRMIVAPHTGSGGPRWGLGEDWREYRATMDGMRPYGLPLQDLPGIRTWDDLAEGDNAARMGQAMIERMGRGDTAVNLAATSLVTNAWLYSHDPALAGWVVDYVDAWRERAAANGGLIPDNVGPSGLVGELHGGAWYGGHYGWQWPHGLHSVEAGAAIGALNHVIVTGGTAALDLAREPLDTVLARARVLDAATAGLDPRWAQKVGLAEGAAVRLIPWRHGPEGWFDWAPPPLNYPVWLWWVSRSAEDLARLDELEAGAAFDWTATVLFHDKEEQGHEAPWFTYLRGRNPSYPVDALELALAQVARRLALMRATPHGPSDDDIHWWQRLNPVVTEVLTQLTTGAPPALYNGGLGQASVLYGDADLGRPGLPEDVAALVTTIDETGVELELVNLGSSAVRRVVVQAGAFGEDRIDGVHSTSAEGGFPGSPLEYGIPSPGTTTVDEPAGSARITVTLPPLTRVALRLDITRRAYVAHHASFAHHQQENHR